jgi:hypothetical protein
MSIYVHKCVSRSPDNLLMSTRILQIFIQRPISEAQSLSLSLSLFSVTIPAACM